MDGLDDRAHHLVAYTSEHAVIAAVRIVGPEQRPFDFERFFDLRPILGPERRPALIGRLVVRRDHRRVRSGHFVLVGLLKLSVHFALKNGITDLMLYTYENLIAFYKSAGFEPLSGTFDHPDWGEVSLMRLNVTDLARRSRPAEAGIVRLIFNDDLDGEFKV
jgi:predicted GNAT family N-acyltransferase